MPKYEITLSTGRKLQVEADKAPSEQDVMAYLAKQPESPKTGLLEPGNVDLTKQPKVKNPDGNTSTVFSRSFEMDGKEVLLPSVTADGRFLASDDDVLKEYKQTGRHLGIFADEPSATRYAKRLHQDYAAGKYEPRTMADTASDVAIGAAKGLGNTVFGLGKIVHDWTPIGRISDAIQPGAFAQRPTELEPTNTAQKVGYGAEQVGEFFIPASTVGKVAKGVNVAKDAALAYAQTGSPMQAGVTGAMTAAIPGASAMNRASTALKQSAQDTMANALRATKEWAKDESEKLAPEMLQRGIGGSIRSMRDLARKTAARVGQNLDDAYKSAAAAGETVAGDVVRGNIQLASDALHTTTAAGGKIVIPGHEAAIAQLDALQEFVGQLGTDIPVDKAAMIKQTWDHIVSKAGLYGQNATAPATEKAAAFSFREAANSFRDLLNTNPDLAALNKEAGFWIGLRDVLNATKLRKVGQTGGLIRAGAATVGAGVGAVTGDSPGERAANSIIGGLAGQQFVKLVQSPTFMTKVSAPMKNALADALASGSGGQVRAVTSRIVSALPAQFRPAMSQ